MGNSQILKSSNAACNGYAFSLLPRAASLMSLCTCQTHASFPHGSPLACHFRMFDTFYLLLKPSKLASLTNKGQGKVKKQLPLFIWWVLLWPTNCISQLVFHDLTVLHLCLFPACWYVYLTYFHKRQHTHYTHCTHKFVRRCKWSMCLIHVIALFKCIECSAYFVYVLFMCVVLFAERGWECHCRRRLPYFFWSTTRPWLSFQHQCDRCMTMRRMTMDFCILCTRPSLEWDDHLALCDFLLHTVTHERILYCGCKTASSHYVISHVLVANYGTVGILIGHPRDWGMIEKVSQPLKVDSLALGKKGFVLD